MKKRIISKVSVLKINKASAFVSLATKNLI